MRDQYLPSGWDKDVCSVVSMFVTGLCMLHTIWRGKGLGFRLCVGHVLQ